MLFRNFLKAFALTVNGNTAKIGGNFTKTKLRIEATNESSAYANSVGIELHGYEGRAKGIYITDQNTPHKWFLGEGYNYTGVGIGYSLIDKVEYSENNKLFISTNGNVGIGTTNPSYKFQVTKTESENNTEYLLGSFINKNNGGGVYLGYYANGSAAKQARVRSGGSIDLALGTSKYQQQLIIRNSDGNVGIGRANPEAKLDIAGSTRIINHLDILPNNLPTHVSSKILLKSHDDYRGDGIFTLGQTNNWFFGNPYTDHANSFMVGVTSKENGTDPTAQKQFAKFIINSNGNVGIGTTSPNYKLQVARTESDDNTEYLVGSFINKNNSGGVYLGYLADGNDAQQARVRSGGSIDLVLGTSRYQSQLIIKNSNGNIGIGTSDPKNKLSVNGHIWAKEIKVQLTDGADWVFDDDYNLRPLSEVETFIEENKHLPEIPSADEFRKNDMQVSEMVNKLLQKIEELTLYTIEQQKEIGRLKEENKDILDIQRRLEKLESKN